MNALNVMLLPEDRVLLHRLAESSQRSDEEIAAAALREYLRFESEQIDKIRSGIEAADKGDFASDDEVAAFFAAQEEAR
ncbi:MAG: CopG family transcriptional regulator [Rhodocyclaceae bacterium]|nr:CopG family transcriptional regulator [Rhodocyclaceae bacterium]